MKELKNLLFLEGDRKELNLSQKVVRIKVKSRIAKKVEQK